MSRTAKWKLEKTKVKVVFRLQCHATHIPQTGWDKLFISFIPAGSGKATSKTTKANVRNGTCKWGDPIYETTRLLQDGKTKQYEEKLYKLVVTMGSSRSSLLGEASINLADFVDALKPTSVSLPLRGSDSGALLHVTVQLLTSKTGFREFEQQRELSERGLQEHVVNDQIFQVNSRAKFRSEAKILSSHEQEAGLNEYNIDSAAGFDGSSNTSESLYAEKHDTSSAHEIDSIKSTVSGDLAGLSVSQSPTPEKGDPSREIGHSGDWGYYWGTGNVDNDLATVYQENNRLKGSLEEAELTIYMLKQEMSTLQSNADSINVETQKLAEQLVTEISSEQQLAKEISFMKSECLKFKGDIEHLRNKKLASLSQVEPIGVDQSGMMLVAKQRWLNGLLLLEERLRDLSNKAYAGFQEKDFKSLLSYLESSVSIVQDLKQVPELLVSPCDEVRSAAKVTGEIGHINLPKGDNCALGTGFGTDLCHPEGLLHCLSIPGLVSNDLGSTDAANAMQGEIFKLLRELDDSKVERESLMRKMDQMECYYEALIQELEGNQKLILGELQNLRNEHSACVYTISSTKAQMEAIHQEMSDQVLKLTEEKCSLDSFNKELERRAVTSEAALKRARLNYSVAVNQLQKDLEVLSLQVLSMYETNENLIRKAFSEGLQPCIEDCSEVVSKEKPDDEELITPNLVHCQSQKNVGKDNLPSGNLLLEDLQRSLVLQEKLYKKVEEELCEMHLDNVHLVVFAKALQEILYEGTTDLGLLKQELCASKEQLELCTSSKELLNLQLQTAMNDVCALNEDKAKYFAKNNDLAMRNKTLEEKMKTVYDENSLLNQRIEECEKSVTEYSSHKSSYEACTTAKTELEKLLEQATAENGILSSEVSSTKEALQKIRDELDEVAASKECLHKTLESFRARLQNILTAYGAEFGSCFPFGETVDSDTELNEFGCKVSQLETLHHILSEKIHLLLKEKRLLEEERDAAQSSLASTKSEAEAMKQTFERHVPDIVQRVEASHGLVHKLQDELEVMNQRLQECSPAEEKFIRRNEELISDFDRMESELEGLISEQENLATEIISMGCLSEELVRLKQIVEEQAHEKRNLTASLQSKEREFVTLESDLDDLKDNLRSLTAELSIERSSRERLEAEVSDLNCRLKERCEKLLGVDQHESELLRLNRLVLEMELEKSRVCHQLSDAEERLKEAVSNSSSVTYLETCLLDTTESLIAADVKCTYVMMQHGGHIEDLVLQLESSGVQLHNLNEKCTMLNRYNASKIKVMEENEKLLSTLESARSELEALASDNRSLTEINSVIADELRDYKEKSVLLEGRFAQEKAERVVETELLKTMVGDGQKEIDNCLLSEEELGIKFLVLEQKFREDCGKINVSADAGDKSVRLQKCCEELQDKLAEQVLKTEEYRNLSTHLKELKDKAEAECLQARERRPAEGPSIAVQESLRIAFLKEQYETKLQDLRHQLSMSKKHCEEMLCKFQDAVDELENRKRSEASHLKRNEELLQKLSEMDAELQSLQSILSDYREKVNAYDQLKAELECSLISLECCKEEKQKLMASLEECNDEKSSITDQVNLLKDMLSNERAVGKTHFGNTTEATHSDSSNGLIANRGIENSDEARPRRAVNLSSMQDGSISRDTEENHGKCSEGGENVGDNDSKGSDTLSDQFNSQKLMSGMELLYKELEKMRNENSPNGESCKFETNTTGLQTDMLHLEKVNEDLRAMCPQFNDFSNAGNSVERVLALELELAEALQTKKKSSFQFQSSFLKQHSDEVAVFRSFKDINELIKDMLDLKEKYGTVETELKEMHERYSQLSLQFAEVEGERQKLMMTLKNVRSTKKLLSRSPSSSPIKEDAPSLPT